MTAAVELVYANGRVLRTEYQRTFKPFHTRRKEAHALFDQGVIIGYRCTDRHGVEIPDWTVMPLTAQVILEFHRDQDFQRKLRAVAE